MIERDHNSIPSFVYNISLSKRYVNIYNLHIHELYIHGCPNCTDCQYKIYIDNIHLCQSRCQKPSWYRKHSDMKEINEFTISIAVQSVPMRFIEPKVQNQNRTKSSSSIQNKEKLYKISPPFVVIFLSTFLKSLKPVNFFQDFPRC